MREETFNMTKQEIKKLRVIDQTIAKNITIREAAELLNLSERQVLRLKKGVLEQGATFVIHKNRGRKPGHAISDSTKDKIVKLKQSEAYQEANFAHFQELIGKYEGISVSYPTVYRALKKAGITSPKKKRKRKVHNRRKRKPQEGMLVQIDTSPHPWIIGGESFLFMVLLMMQPERSLVYILKITNVYVVILRLWSKFLPITVSPLVYTTIAIQSSDRQTTGNYP